MSREPFPFFLFRLFLILACLFVVCMLYWSSSLIEQDLKVVQKELLHIKNTLSLLKEEKEKTSPPVLPSSNVFLTEKPANLLTLDPFYTKTLPQLLGPDFKSHGTRREASIAKPEHLHPFSNWSHVATWNTMCTVSLAAQAIGRYETLVPDMALSMEVRKNKEGAPEYWLFLRRDLFWQPLDPLHFSQDVVLASHFLQRHLVTAHDFKFYFDAVMNPYVEQTQAVALRSYLEDIEDMRVIDDFTLVVRWKSEKITGGDGEETRRTKYLAKVTTASLRPLARFVYQYFADGTKIVEKDEDSNIYRTSLVWAQNFAHHWAKNVIVSCGPWLFDGMTEREIRFRRNPHYYQPYAVLVEALEIKFRDSQDAIWMDFKTGSLDFIQMPPYLLGELVEFLKSSPYQYQKEQGLEIRRLVYLDASYSYIGWNETNPLFSSQKVRQALTLAIDRERIIRQNLNGLAIQATATFFSYAPSYQSPLPPYPFDPDAARQLLRQEGWVDHDGDGLIDKEIEGRLVPFRFRLVYYVKNPTAKSICDYVSTALKEIGIECIPRAVDIADLSAIFEDKDFEALFLAWAVGSPPDDPRQLWYSTGAKEKGSSNVIGFANQKVDRIIDQLAYTDDPKARLALYTQFDRILYDEAPCIFFRSKTVLAYRSYLQNVFIPAERQDLIPGANVGEPITDLFWIYKEK